MRRRWALVYFLYHHLRYIPLFRITSYTLWLYIQTWLTNASGARIWISSMLFLLLLMLLGPLLVLHSLRRLPGDGSFVSIFLLDLLVRYPSTQVVILSLTIYFKSHSSYFLFFIRVHPLAKLPPSNRQRRKLTSGECLLSYLPLHSSL